MLHSASTTSQRRAHSTPLSSSKCVNVKTRHWSVLMNSPQLYVNKDRSKTEEQLRRVTKAGYKGICLTVDAPVAGKRERDERSKLDADSVRHSLLRFFSYQVTDSRPQAADPSMRDAVVPAQGIAQSLGS